MAKSVEIMTCTSRASRNAVATALALLCLMPSSDMNQLVRLPQFNAVMQTMAREMEKAGLIDEMMNDTLESLDDDNIDEAADAEVNKVLDEVTATLPAAANSRLPEVRVPAAAQASVAEDNELAARVAGLKAI